MSWRAWLLEPSSKLSYMRRSMSDRELMIADSSLVAARRVCT
jgi:hypothetical protein